MNLNPQMHERLFNVYFDASEDSPSCKPERALLTAILERAYRDLLEPDFSEARRSAIAWFIPTDDVDEHNANCVSFKMCYEILDLTASEVKYFQALASEIHGSSDIHHLHIKRIRRGRVVSLKEINGWKRKQKKK